MIHATTSAGRRGIAAALLASALTLPTAAVAAEAGEPFGRVVALHGQAYAKAPDGTVRALECQSPIHEGDEVSTHKGAGLGVLSGDFYARLGEKSKIGVARTVAGTPNLDLTQGHLRLLDAGAAEAPVGRIATPGLVTVKASRDTEALVLHEKISLVSMICGWDSGLDVGRAGVPGEVAHPGSGQCAIEKPREPTPAPLPTSWRWSAWATTSLPSTSPPCCRPSRLPVPSSCRTFCRPRSPTVSPARSVCPARFPS